MKRMYLFFVLFFAVSLCFSAVAFASSGGLVIDEFRTRGEVDSKDEYIVVANYGQSSIDLSGFVLKKITTSGRSYELITFSNTVIAAYQKIILGHTDYRGTKNIIYSKNSISDDNTAIVLYGPGSSFIVDSVTYGTVNFSQEEGKSLSNPEKAIPYKRKNGQDTNNNFNDFYAVLPVPVIDPNLHHIVINELLPNPKSGNEWFELYNPTSYTVNLRGLTICDVYGSTDCYALPAETIPAFGYKSYDNDKSKIILNDDGDALIMKIGTNVIASTPKFSKAANDLSFSLFGGVWKWTMTLTKNKANVLTAVPPKTSSEKSSTKSSDKKYSGDGSSESTSNGVVSGESSTQGMAQEVKGIEGVKANNKISRKEVGMALMMLAVFVIFGYTAYENRGKLNDFYHKFKRRNN